MKMLTLKLKPKTLFGIVLLLTGIAVIAITFVSHNVAGETAVANVINAATDEQRVKFINSFGWEVEKEFETKQITIPSEFNDVYTSYNEIQKNQGFDLSNYKGKTVTLYTYTVTNYESDSEQIIADLLVCDDVLIGGDICNTDASNGFLVGFEG